MLFRGLGGTVSLGGSNVLAYAFARPWNGLFPRGGDHRIERYPLDDTSFEPGKR